MNQKLMVAGVSAALGAVLLVTTAFTGLANASGYESYKTAVKNSIKAANYTGNFEVNIKDNDNQLVDVTTLVKTNKDSGEMSRKTTIDAGSQQKTIEMFRQDGKSVMKNSDSDTYFVSGEGNKMIRKGPGKNEAVRDVEAAKAGEAVLDALVGNLKDYVNMQSTADGKSEISMQLSSGQIPAFANALASLAVKRALNGKEMQHRGQMLFGANLDINAPKLVSDININSVDFNALVNKDNFIENQTADVVITGKDAEGKEHSVAISVNMSVTDINSTTPDKVNLTGKQVKTADPRNDKGPRGRVFPGGHRGFGDFKDGGKTNSEN